MAGRLLYKTAPVRGAFRGGAQVAQLVEHATENRSVGGSIPPLGTRTINYLTGYSRLLSRPGPGLGNASDNNLEISIFGRIFGSTCPRIGEEWAACRQVNRCQ